jgi:AhpD family alkylhydroperoxidase
MTSRPNPYASRYDLVRPLIEFGSFSQDGLDPTLAELIKIRASQINGCSYCLFLHTRDARKNGEAEERIIMLDARESPLYSDRERAALAWTEVPTRVHQTGAPDRVSFTRPGAMWKMSVPPAGSSTSARSRKRANAWQSLQ